MKKPLNKKEAAKEDYQDWDDPVKKYTTRKRIRWNYDYVKVAARLVAAGHSEKDLGYVLGVQPCTIKTWKARYPQFKAACANGKGIAKNYLVSSGLRAACGYDFEEETYELRVVEGNAEKELVCVKRVKKHQKPDASLLQFFLINMSDSFTNTKNVNITENKKVVSLELTGRIESDQIRDFAGRLLKQAEKQDKIKTVESKVTDAT